MSNLCPSCGSEAVSTCRCFIADSKCASGHEWHWCKVHRVKVAGVGRGHAQVPQGCTCGEAGRKVAELSTHQKEVLGAAIMGGFRDELLKLGAVEPDHFERVSAGSKGKATYVGPSKKLWFRRGKSTVFVPRRKALLGAAAAGLAGYLMGSQKSSGLENR